RTLTFDRFGERCQSPGHVHRGALEDVCSHLVTPGEASAAVIVHYRVFSLAAFPGVEMVDERLRRPGEYGSELVSTLASLQLSGPLLEVGFHPGHMIVPGVAASTRVG